MTDHNAKVSKKVDGDIISRQAAINAAIDAADDWDGGYSLSRADMIERAINNLPSAQPETYEERTEAHACDLIDRQAAIDAINKAFERVFAWDGTGPLGDKVLENVPSAQPEQLTDKEQRIFLAAMGREEKVCKQVDEECRDCREPYEDSLVKVCHEIIRKVKAALWET